MSIGPQLRDGEEVIHHHVPNLGAFKKTALLLIMITLVPTVVIAFVVPDSFWVAVPLFVTCLLLMQERYNLGKHAAWVTNQRIILQRDGAIALSDITSADVVVNAVRLRSRTGGAGAGPTRKLNYPKDRTALANIIETAKANR